MVQYDTELFKQFAGALYARAQSVMVRYTLFGALIGAGAGCGVSEATSFAMIPCAIGGR